MYAPDLCEFKRYEVSTVTEIVREIKGEKFRSVGINEDGTMQEVKLVCYKCVGTARRDMTNHGMCSAQASSNSFGTQDSKLRWSPLCR